MALIAARLSPLWSLTPLLQKCSPPSDSLPLLWSNHKHTLAKACLFIFSALWTNLRVLSMKVLSTRKLLASLKLFREDSPLEARWSAQSLRFLTWSLSIGGKVALSRRFPRISLGSSLRGLICLPLPRSEWLQGFKRELHALLLPLHWILFRILIRFHL